LLPLALANPDIKAIQLNPAMDCMMEAFHAHMTFRCDKDGTPR
jgi:hypothetical protein